MKNKILVILLFLMLFGCIVLGGLVFYYNKTLKEERINSKTGKKDNKELEDTIILEIKQGMTSKQVIDTIYNAGFLKNKYVGYTYIKLNKNLNLQAGIYELTNDMGFLEVMNKINSGEVVDNSIAVTFVEGKRITYFVQKIAENFTYSEEEIFDKISSDDYLNYLIDKYWFLTDEILNDKIYYPLEGYLYPNTYLFNKGATVEEIIEKLLNSTDKVLTNYKDLIENSEYSVHQLLTMASIVELEGANSDDRRGVAGVFYNRLNSGWSLGSDVTTYYAAKIDFGDRDLYQYEIDAVNDYNTRSSAMAGKLPVGPICSPSSLSIDAVLNPLEHNYYYFVADKNKKTYFSENYNQHIEIINKLKAEGLWYQYK